MARRAKATLNSKTARKLLGVRKNAHFVEIRPGLHLGYIRRDPPPGSWTRRELVDGKYSERTIATADDVALADGHTVLSFEQARDLAANEGTPKRSNEPLTVTKAMDAYLVALEGRSKHAKEARQRADLHIIPVLGRYRIVKLTKTILEAWRAGLVKEDSEDDADAKRRSQDSANRILTLCKACLNHAYEDGHNNIPSDSAWRSIKAYKKVGRARTDHFTVAEVKKLIDKARSFDRAFANLCEAGFLTGARLGELVQLDVRDFDAPNGQLMVREGKTGSRAIVLPGEAVTFFKKLTKDRPPRAVLLPRADGDRWGKSEQHRPFKRAAKLAELSPTSSFYTLRHSHVSVAVSAPVPLPLTLLAENLGTSLLMLEQTYAHLFAKQRRELIEERSPKLRRVK